jgi:hypothetical protein
MTELLVCCLPVCVTQLRSDPLLGRGVLVWLGTQMNCTKIFNRIDAVLDQNKLCDANGKNIIQSLRVTLTLTFILISFVYLFILQVRRSRLKMMKTKVDNLGLGFFYFSPLYFIFLFTNTVKTLYCCIKINKVIFMFILHSISSFGFQLN